VLKVSPPFDLVFSRGSLKRNSGTPAAVGGPIPSGTGNERACELAEAGTRSEDKLLTAAGSSTNNGNQSKSLEVRANAAFSKRESGNLRPPPPPPPPYLPPIPPKRGPSPSSISSNMAMGSSKEEKDSLAMSSHSLPLKRRPSQKKELSKAYSVDARVEKFSNKDKVRAAHGPLVVHVVTLHTHTHVHT